MGDNVASAVPTRNCGVPARFLPVPPCGDSGGHSYAEVDTTVLHEAIPARESGAGGIRAFRRADIPAVVALRRQLFRTSEHASAAELESYLDKIFFTRPIVDDHLSSLVYENESGGLAGFLGIVPRRMLFAGKPLRVAVATQFMVSPQSRSFAARKLARALINGPQDLTLSDAANDGARGMWSSVGGRSSIAYSFSWTYPLRPLRYATMRAARTFPIRALVYGARPLVAVADAALRPRLDGTLLKEYSEEPLDVKHDLPELSELMERWTLRPRYMQEPLEWVLDRVSARTRFGPLQRVVVRDGGGRLVGWYLYCLNRGGVSSVVQFGATKAATESVLELMMNHARRRGAVALSGRFDPAIAQELSDRGASFTRQGPWLLYHSRHTGVEGAIESGAAFLSRLEGEWWMGF